MSDPKIISVITDALLVFAKGVDPQALPKISFSIDYAPSDIEAPTWKFGVMLRGLERINDNGEEVFAYERKWEAEGDGVDEAANACLKTLIDNLRQESTQRRREAEQVANSVTAAVGLLASSVESLSSIWRDRDPDEDGFRALVAEAEVEARNGAPTVSRPRIT